MKSTRPEGMDPQMWNMLRPWRAAEAKKAAKAAKLVPQPQVAPLEPELAKQDAPDAGGGSSLKPPIPVVPACTSLALGEIPLAVVGSTPASLGCTGEIPASHRNTGAIPVPHRAACHASHCDMGEIPVTTLGSKHSASGEIPLVDLLARFDPSIVIDDGTSGSHKLVHAMVVQESSCPTVPEEESYDEISNYEYQRRLGCEMPTDQESSGEDDPVPDWEPRWHCERASGSGDPRSSAQMTYIYDDSDLLDPSCQPFSSRPYGPGTRILIQFGLHNPWQTRILCERVVDTIWVLHSSDGDITCVDLSLKKNAKMSALKICNDDTWIVPDGVQRLRRRGLKRREPPPEHWKAILSYADRIAKGERFLQCITRGQQYMSGKCAESFAFDASTYCPECMHMFCEPCYALGHHCPYTYERYTDAAEKRYLPVMIINWKPDVVSFMSDSKSHSSSSSNEEPMVLVNPQAPGYDTFAHQVYVAHEMETEPQQNLLRDIRAQTHPAVAGVVVDTTGDAVAKAKAKAKAVAKSRAAAKVRAQARAHRPVTILCDTCHTTWIIDDQDRDFHITQLRWERFGCTVCRPASDEESSDYEHNWEGFSLSDADHDDPRGMPVLEAQQWDEWEDKVEEFRRNLPQCQSAVASAPLDKGIIVELDMGQQMAPAMPTILPEKRPHREKLSDRVIPLNLMVARPVGKQEMNENPDAQAATKKEWAALRQQ